MAPGERRRGVHNQRQCVAGRAAPVAGGWWLEVHGSWQTNSKGATSEDKPYPGEVKETLCVVDDIQPPALVCEHGCNTILVPPELFWEGNGNAWRKTDTECGLPPCMI